MAAERLADLAAQIGSVRQLNAVVTALRGIATARAQRGRSLLPGIDAYAEVVSRAIGQALSLSGTDRSAAPGDGATRRGLILFCAEQGFAGSFSERVLDRLATDPDGATIFLVGTRGLVVARERGIEPAWYAPMVTRADLVSDLANRLADAVYARLLRDGLNRLDVVFCRTVTTGSIETDRLSLLPIDFTRFERPVARRLPLTNLPPSLLLERLADEYVYAQLCRAAMHAFEAENQARMVAMTSARNNIEAKLDDLGQRERRLRQDEITVEILELATGAAAAAKS